VTDSIHAAILSAMRDIATVGISKSSRNKDQGYNFRGVEDAMNQLSPILIKNKIIVTASYSDHKEAERETKSGGRMKFVTLKGSFKFEAPDKSFVTSEAYGEGADTSDKATTKAMSVAFRTALFQQFVVPTMAMDPEQDEEETDDEMLAGFKDAALGGSAALEQHFKSHKPPPQFWRAHGDSLKAAAAAADKATKQ
jgi:hypothetical protein